MARSDFNIVPINQKLTPSNPSVTVNFPIEGSASPIDDAFLAIQLRSVSNSGHRIEINDIELPGMDLPPAPGNSQAWMSWVEHVPPGVLISGNNKMTIHRNSSGHDNFDVGMIVVNWRE